MLSHRKLLFQMVGRPYYPNKVEGCDIHRVLFSCLVVFLILYLLLYCCFVLYCLVVSSCCLVLSCLVLSCCLALLFYLVLSCYHIVLSCLVLSCLLSGRVQLKILSRAEPKSSNIRFLQLDPKAPILKGLQPSQVENSNLRTA